MHDIIIIGAGVAGCACARELSRYSGIFWCWIRRRMSAAAPPRSTALLAHVPATDAAHGNLMAKLTNDGQPRMPALARSWILPTPSAAVCRLTERGGTAPGAAKNSMKNGIANGVEGLRISSGTSLLRYGAECLRIRRWRALGGAHRRHRLPVRADLRAGRKTPQRTADVSFNTQVTGCTLADGRGWAIETDRGTLEARCIVNAAGVYADVLHNMADADHPMKITSAARRLLPCLTTRPGSMCGTPCFSCRAEYRQVRACWSPHGAWEPAHRPTAIMSGEGGPATTAAGLGW